jgi:hypothetical protein
MYAIGTHPDFVLGLVKILVTKASLRFISIGLIDDPYDGLT